MGLFDQIVSAINDPGKKAGAEVLQSLLSGLQSQGESEGGGFAADDLQKLVVALGAPVKKALMAIEQSPTPESAADVVAALSSIPKASPDLLDKLFGSGGHQQVSNDLSQKTGIDVSKIMAMLPVVLPLVMKLFNSGGSAAPQGASGAAAGLANNPILKGFLDSDKDGDVDLADVLKMAGPFLSGKG